MGKSRRASEKRRHQSGAVGSSESDGAGSWSDDFELYDEDVWEDGHMGRFAKERWSEGPRRRRSQWLRQQLDLASEGGEDDLSPFSRIG